MPADSRIDAGAMRVAALDIGSNSTRLLLAEIDDGAITEISRRSIITRLGDGVDASGLLNQAAIDRVRRALDQYAEQIAAAGCVRSGGVATSAVREAGNGPQFAASLSEEFGIPITVIDGDREAQLTFTGVGVGGRTAEPGRRLVVDIGGGSTEFIVGDGGDLLFHVSTRLGAVRQGERHLAGDPPGRAELEALMEEASSVIAGNVPAEYRRSVTSCIAVAGTPTTLASIQQKLEVFDPWKVHGYAITEAACRETLEQVASLPLAERREVVGLHPDRAPTIVAGAAILLAAMQTFELGEVTVSEHDLLYGVASELADG